MTNCTLPHRAIVIATLSLSLLTTVGMADSTNQELLSNGSFESTSGWSYTLPWARGSSNPTAYDGSYYFAPSLPTPTTITQTIALEDLDLNAEYFATGGYRVQAKGYRNNNSNASSGRIQLIQTLSDNTKSITEVNNTTVGNAWTKYVKYALLNPETTKLTYQYTSTANTAYLDAASMVISQYSIWSYGGVTDVFRNRNPISTTGNFAIGRNNSTGKVFVTRRKTWTTSGKVLLGEDQNSTGKVTIRSGTWQAKGAVQIGDYSAGTVIIENNGKWNSADTVTFGEWSGGTVNLTGGTWNADGTVQLGQYCDAFVNIGANGTWNSNGVVRTVDTGTSTGRSKINVNGGTWNAGGKTYIGMNQENPYGHEMDTTEVHVTNNGLWTTDDDTYLGYTEYSTVETTFDNGRFVTDGALHVGHACEIDLQLKNGSTWTSNQYVYVSGTHGLSSSVNLTDGSSWTNSEHVYLGHTGDATLNIDSTSSLTSTANIFYAAYWRDTDATINLDGGTWTANGDATWLGNMGSAKVNLTNGATWDSSSEVALGYLKSGEGTVNLSNSTWNSTGVAYIGQGGQGTLVIKDDGEWNTSDYAIIGSLGDGYVQLYHGTWNSSGTARIGGSGDGEVQVSYSGLLNSNGTLEIGEDGLLDIVNSGKVNIRGEWTNKGKIRLGNSSSALNIYHSGALGDVDLDNGTLTTYGNATVLDASNVIVGANNTFQIDQGATLAVGSGKALTVNSRINILDTDVTLQLDGGVLTHANNQLDLNGATLQGNGQVFVGSKGLNLGTDGSVLGTSSSNGLFIWGHVSGSGTMTNVAVYGDVSVGNSIGTITADEFTLTSAGTLTMELGGLTAGTQYDQIILDGLLTLDGDLDILWYNGFEAELGNTFTLIDMTNGTLSGQFDEIFLPTFSDVSLAWDTSNLYTNGTIAVASIVPEPAMTLLILTGSIACLLRRRRGK